MRSDFVTVPLSGNVLIFFLFRGAEAPVYFLSLSLSPSLYTCIFLNKKSVMKTKKKRERGERATATGIGESRLLTDRGWISQFPLAPLLLFVHEDGNKKRSDVEEGRAMAESDGRELVQYSSTFFFSPVSAIPTKKNNNEEDRNSV